MTTEPTLADLNQLLGSFRDGAVSAYHFASDHEARTEALESILEFTYDQLVENRHLNYEHSEDALSAQIISQLKMVGIEADHDTQVGGHCDILVRSKDHFLWIGEAKIHRDYNWLTDGFKQLSTRYSTGSYGQCNAEVIIYCRNKKASEVLKNWQVKMQATFPDVTLLEDNINKRLWFRTAHIHEVSGNPFITRHRIIQLYYNPQK